ncbi:MAG: ribose 5-phosphate isomerase B [Bacteroidales bacterium]
MNKAGSNVIAIGCDHGGYAMKEFLVKELKARGYSIRDYGTNSEESVDYPDFIHPVASAVNSGEYRFGIVICGSGQGAAMTANKYRNVRAALLWDTEQARLTRQHNDANIVALAGRFLPFDKALEIVEAFLNEPFEGGRHIRRIEKMKLISE